MITVFVFSGEWIIYRMEFGMRIFFI